MSASTAARAQAPRSKRQLFSSLKRLRKRPPTSTRRPLQRHNREPTFALQESLSIKPCAGRTAFFKLSIMQNIFCITFEVSHDHGWRGACASTIRDGHDRCAVAAGSTPSDSANQIPNAAWQDSAHRRPRQNLRRPRNHRLPSSITTSGWKVRP